MRIVGGIDKGKKLYLPNDKKTRPLKDLVKESIFNLIKHSNKINFDINNSVVLDFFAGSGSFGLECLSRGAKKAIFFENYSTTLNILKKNIKKLDKINKSKIYEDDIFDFLSSSKNIDNMFDIIFLDPPYKENRIREILENIIEKKILNNNGLIILHRHRKDKTDISDKLNIIDVRYYGISKIYFISYDFNKIL